MAGAKKVLVYGSYGYTGSLIVRYAADHGVDVVLSGRSHEKLAAQAAATKYEALPAAAEAESGTDLDNAVARSDIAAVLNCAGPFTRTFNAVVQCCLRHKKHYLDITGEIPVFEAAQKRDAEAQQAGIIVMPGVGFDVVPTDCMANYLKQKLPDATHLEMAFAAVGGGMSHGTATTIVEGLGRRSVARKNGILVEVDSGADCKTIDYGDPVGPKYSMGIPWGDLSTAFWSTGIPNIAVYIPTPRAAASMAWISSAVPGVSHMTRFIAPRVGKWFVPKWGPSEDQNKNGRSYMYGEARRERNGVVEERVQARLEVAEGYEHTAHAALECAKRAIAQRQGDQKGGYFTPASLWGHELVTQVPGSGQFTPV